MAMKFYSDCVSWTLSDVHVDGGLVDLINQCHQITRQTFLKHVDRKQLHEIELALGYEKHPKQGLTMSSDFAVSYYRSKHHGERIYLFKHSGIEYVFKKTEEN